MKIQFQTSGPLVGIRVVEFSGIGPGPFACMMLSDMGAEVVTVDRPGRKYGDATAVTSRGRTVVEADLKNAQHVSEVLDLCAGADVLIEGFRPGVMERLGLGPDVLLARNPKLVYGRMTGWGQDGPLSRCAGHDINYIAITGALHAIGPAGGAPIPPLNLLGDFGGGSLYLVVGVLAALNQAQRSGHGQVVDAAITDGVISLMSNLTGSIARGTHREQRGTNLLDGGVPWYGVYETKDGCYISIGALEPQFYDLLSKELNLSPEFAAAREDRSRWPELRAALKRKFAERTREEWSRYLEGTDTCFGGVLSLNEAKSHPHNISRAAFIDVEGLVQPAPAPRFSRTPSAVQGPPAKSPALLADVLERWGRLS